MRGLILASTALAAVAFAAPASATLQIAGVIAGGGFTCIDNAACDNDAAIGSIKLTDQTIFGVTVNGSVQTSTGTPGNPGPIDILNTSSLSIINATGALITGRVTVSDTSFAVPVSSISLSASGTWETAVGSSATMEWFADTSNTQGADTAIDTPGTQLDSFTSTPLLIADSLSHNGSVAFNAAAPFSMTESVFFNLSAGGSLLSRGQTMLATPTATPEPATMMLLGAGLVGLAAVRRRT